MERKRSKQASLLLWAAVAALLSQNLVIPVKSAANFVDQKTYYPPDPHAGTPPSPTVTPSHPPSGGGHATPTPSRPSHGGGSHHGGTPPANCGTPPSGGHHHGTPVPPRHGGGSGGYYQPPPTSTPTTPTTPTPTTPTTPTPTTPIINPPTIVSPPTVITPPSTPIVIPGIPTTPGINIPSPPFPFDPNSPPFPCSFWRNHPTLIFGLFGFWGTSLGGALGTSSLPGLPGSGASTSLLEALSNSRSDGLGELYREGTAALLNSMVHPRFPYSTSQVRDSFVAALGSNKAAAAQARLFKQANEGKTTPRV